MSLPPPAVLKLIEADLRRPREWDGEPELLLIYGHTFGAALVPCPLPEMVWAVSGHPVVVLETLDDLARAEPMAVAGMIRAVNVPGGHLLVGLALRCEAWMGENMSEEEAARVDAGELLIKDLPGRHEVRFTAAADVAGVEYMASLRRADGVLTSGHSGDDGGDWTAGGRVPAALSECLGSLLRAQGAMYS